MLSGRGLDRPFLLVLAAQEMWYGYKIICEKGIQMILLLFWLLCGVVAGMIGSNKGAGCSGFALGILLGPIGILIALLMKGNKKQCPVCKEYIHKDAIKCPKCQSAQAQEFQQMLH